MRVFLVPQVAKFLRKERVSQAVLCLAGREVVAGTLGVGEADLGGGLFKKRIARAGRGKSSGYRVIVAYRPPQTERVLFAFAFAKNTASTLAPSGQAVLARAAVSVLAADDDELALLLTAGTIGEVKCDAEEQG